MSDEEYRPRPNDDLVEPLFGGIHGADEAASPEDGRSATPASVWIVLGLLTLLAVFALGLYFLLVDPSLLDRS